MKRIIASMTFAVLLAGTPSHAAPWKNDTLGISIDLPKGWSAITARVAQRKAAAAKEPHIREFYLEVKRGVTTGQFALFEKAGDDKARADIQMTALGRPIPPLQEQDIRNLCPMWAKNHGEDERRFIDCQPRKLGEAWTAFFIMAPDAAGNTQYRVKCFRPDGFALEFTVDGTAAQAEAMFRNTRFY